ncbi:MAG TPA: hypothetical protein HPQ00_05440 [Magnetococcales bacterium]|nr:hypothetical protein [Magnetococcales bacterium]
MMHHRGYGKRLFSLLGALSLLPVLAVAEDSPGEGPRKGLVASGREVASGESVPPSGFVRMGEKGRESGDRSWRGNPGGRGDAVENSGAAATGWKESTTGLPPPMAVPERGWGGGSRDASRYWDPPPGFRGEAGGEGEGAVGPDPEGEGVDRLPGRRFGDGGGLGGGAGLREEAAGGGSQGTLASDRYHDSETLDPRREIDPYFLRKQRRDGYAGSGRSWSGDAGRGYGGEDGYRGRPGIDSRYDDSADRGWRYRDGGIDAEGRGYRGQGFSEDDRSYPDRRGEGSGPYRGRGEEGYWGRGDPREEGNGGGGSFSWNSC